MHEYDIALKSALRRLSGSVIRQLAGCRVVRWQNVELAAVKNPRADMLGEIEGGGLLHIELQSTNDAKMAGRMLEYAAAIYLQFGQIPRQMVLYVGSRKLRMKGELAGPQWTFQCRMVDIRQLDGDQLIAGGQVEDNVVAVLTSLRDERMAIRRILQRIAQCAPHERALAFEELLLLAGLRSLAPIVEEEVKQVPILDDIMDHPTIGPRIRRGMEQGLKQGREEGREEGERRIVLRMIAQKFGEVPPAVRKRVEALPPSGLDEIAMRLLNASSLNELLKTG